MNWHRPVRVFSCCALPFAAWLTWQLLKAGLGWYGLAGFGSCCCFTVLAAGLTGEIRAGNSSANRVGLVTARAWFWCSLAGKAHRRAFRAALERRERLARKAAPGSSRPLTEGPPPMRPWSFPAVTVRELEAARTMLEAEKRLLEQGIVSAAEVREIVARLDRKLAASFLMTHR